MEIIKLVTSKQEDRLLESYLKAFYRVYLRLRGRNEGLANLCKSAGIAKRDLGIKFSYPGLHYSVLNYIAIQVFKDNNPHLVKVYELREVSIDYSCNIYFPLMTIGTFIDQDKVSFAGLGKYQLERAIEEAPESIVLINSHNQWFIKTEGYNSFWDEYSGMVDCENDLLPYKPISFDQEVHNISFEQVMGSEETEEEYLPEAYVLLPERVKVLAEAKSNYKEAAAKLGMKEKTLREWIRVWRSKLTEEQKEEFRELGRKKNIILMNGGN